MKLYLKVLFLVSTSFTTSDKIKSQCIQNYNWTTWQSFSGLTATGIISNNNQSVIATMTANYIFSSTPDIFNYTAFNGFNGYIPNSTVPKTTWSAGAGGITTMCFNQTVADPILLLSSLGAPNLAVTLHFSLPYLVLFDGGGMTYTNDTTITGKEGNAILLFPGNFSCVTIYSTTPENYTNISWGLKPPLFPVSVTGNPINCDSVVLTANGGVSYSWNGGIYPNSATNTFYVSGTYFLTTANKNGCTVTTSQTVVVKQKKTSIIGMTICEGQSYLGYVSTGTYIDTLGAVNGCDSIRTLNLIVKPKAITTVNQSICQGQSYLGYSSTGTYIDTLITVNGCDSIRTLNLIVKPKSFVTINQSICQGQSYFGYSSTGTYTDTLMGASGCDSIRTLNLSVKPKILTAIKQSICKGQSYSGYTIDGTYIDTFLSASGCDSIRTLNLNVKPSYFSSLTVSICKGQDYFGHTVSGIYLDTTQSINGCDSIIRTVLTVVSNCDAYFPSAFTPNNDGRNDVFKVLNATNLVDYDLSIYNRWGQKVFETKNCSDGWNGTYKGFYQPNGVYIWYSTFKTLDKNRSMKGTVLLMRL